METPTSMAAPGRDQTGMLLPTSFTIPRSASLAIGAVETLIIAAAIVLAVLAPSQRTGKRNLPAR